MRLLRLQSIFVLSVISLLVGPVRAQRLAWTVAHPDHDQRYHYFFTALSGYGESCIATMLRQDDSIKIGPKFWQMFLRTDDGGVTWRELDPGFPAHKGQNERVLVAIQMIDSSTVVAIGDSGLLLRSVDGGQHWSESRLGVHTLLYVNFVDPDHGIVVSQSEPSVFTTLDGGKRWDSTSLYYEHPGYYWAASPEALGGARFRVMSYAAGPLYYTSDNWENVDSSRMLFDTSDIYNVITDLQSNRGDTIIAYGQSRRSSTAALSYGLVVRSIDDGHHWTQVSFPDSILTSPRTITQLDRPFMVASGHGNVYKRPVVALSYDKGLSWSSDTVFLTGVDPNYTFSQGTYVTPSARVISIFQLPVFWSPGALATAKLNTERVEGFERLIAGTRMYPNPADQAITVSSPTTSLPVHVYDLLGREVLRSRLDTSGEAKLQLSSLSPGIYTLTVDHFRGGVCLGRFMVKH